MSYEDTVFEVSAFLRVRNLFLAQQDKWEWLENERFKLVIEKKFFPSLGTVNIKSC